MLATLAAAVLGRDFADADADGLADKWEVEGFGPIDPRVHGCRPGKADVFIVFRLRSTMTAEKIQPTVDRVVRFFARLHYKNPDGTYGLHAVPIVPPPMPKDTDGKGYIELYDSAMPKEWRGLAHGVMLDDSPGGGGQANRPDWCGTGYNWHTIVHELGHQFGLDHAPKGEATGSPFFPSLMNYDYSYQLGGDPDAVGYSRGLFAGTRMRETELDENMPYPAHRLAFLSKHPYYFAVAAAGPGRSTVDWNRNGVAGERRVRADVNDGYSVEYRSLETLGHCAGAPALASTGKELLVAYPDLPEGGDYGKGTAALGPGSPGRIVLRRSQGGKTGPPTVLAEPAVGDPSVAWHRGRLYIAYPVPGGFAASRHRLFPQGHAVDWRGTFLGHGTDPTLATTPFGVVVLVRTDAAGQVSAGEWGGPPRPVAGLASDVPVGAAWNPRRSELAVAVARTQGERRGRLEIVHLARGKDGWAVSGRSWVEGESGSAATSSRPVLLWQGGSDRGPEGGYNVYVKGLTGDPRSPAVNWVCRQTADATVSAGWRTRMMGNEWALSLDPPAAAEHGGDIAFAYRLGFGEGIQKILLSHRASGIEDAVVTDFDEVGFLFRQGLRDSLLAVQKEQGVGMFSPPD
jgi:hypothetical protein